MGYTEKALHGYRALGLKIRALESGEGGGKLKKESVNTSLEAKFMNIQFFEDSGHNLESFRLEVSVYNVYITNQFLPTFAQGGREGGDKIQK